MSIMQTPIRNQTYKRQSKLPISEHARFPYPQLRRPQPLGAGAYVMCPVLDKPTDTMTRLPGWVQRRRKGRAVNLSDETPNCGTILELEGDPFTRDGAGMYMVRLCADDRMVMGHDNEIDLVEEVVLVGGPGGLGLCGGLPTPIEDESPSQSNAIRALEECR